MREIKFSYIYQHEETGNLWRRDIDIQELERGDFKLPHRVTLVARRQFTGLLDKNGKEIYEGDVVKVFMPSNIHNFTVEFHDAAFLLKKLTTGRMWLANVEYPMEVLGNIYEHSHLLNPEIVP